MVDKFLTIVFALLYHSATVECQTCDGCDPDIPSRQTPKDWYQERAQSIICQAGQYLSSENQCKQCLVGTFMTSAMAKTGRYSFCPPCSKVSATVIGEIAVECNSTRDTEIHCKAGNYRDGQCPCTLQCRICSVCGVGSQLFKVYERRPCTQINDTVCCKAEDDLVEDNTCVTKPTTTATTPTPSRGNVEQKPTNNPNSSKATKILYSTILLSFLMLFILL